MRFFFFDVFLIKAGYETPILFERVVFFVSGDECAMLHVEVSCNCTGMFDARARRSTAMSAALRLPRWM